MALPARKQATAAAIAKRLEEGTWRMEFRLSMFCDLKFHERLSASSFDLHRHLSLAATADTTICIRHLPAISLLQYWCHGHVLATFSFTAGKVIDEFIE